jgi:hypothetical protein
VRRNPEQGDAIVGAWHERLEIPSTKMLDCNQQKTIADIGPSALDGDGDYVEVPDAASLGGRRRSRRGWTRRCRARRRVWWGTGGLTTGRRGTGRGLPNCRAPHGHMAGAR